MKKVILLLVVFFSFLLSACQEKTNEQPLVEKAQLLLNQAGFSVNPASIVINDKLFLLNGEKRGVVFYEVGKEQILAEDASSKQWLHYDGKTLYAIWWAVDDQKAKSLKVRTSSDGGGSFTPVVTINTGNGVLAEASVASNGKGAVAVAYTDERKPGYGVYINYSTDSGKTWAAQDQRLDTPVITAAMKAEDNTEPATFANSSKLAYLGDKLVAVWQQMDMTEMGQSMLRLVSKASIDNGKSWQAESTIFAAPNMQPIEMVAFNNATTMYVFGMLTDGIKGLTGFYNTNLDANQWSEISSRPLNLNPKVYNISWIKGAISGDNLALGFIASPIENIGKMHAEVAVLSTKTHEWLGESKNLDADKGHELTKSSYLSIVDADAAGLYVVWEDYRNIVPTLYMNISKDNGKSWLSAPKPVTTPGLLVAKDPKLFLGQDKLWLTYFMVKLDGKNPNGTRVYQEFAKGSDGQFILPDISLTMPSQDELKERLIERANKFWALREERKWEETWDYMEPVYRERFEKTEWLAQQGKLSFSKAVVDESKIDIQGNLAALTANIEVSVNQQVSKEGLLESAPPNKQVIDMKWGWFYDDWYFMPNIVFGNHLEY